jgi:hypothetical protein
MCIVPAAFFSVAEGDGPGFGGDEDDFGPREEEVRAEEGVDYERGANGGCCLAGLVWRPLLGDGVRSE